MESLLPLSALRLSSLLSMAACNPAPTAANLPTMPTLKAIESDAEAQRSPGLGGEGCGEGHGLLCRRCDLDRFRPRRYPGKDRTCRGPEGDAGLIRRFRLPSSRRRWT